MNGKLGPTLHAVLRIAAGLLFMQHGLQKLFGLLGGFNGGRAELMTRYGAAGILEFAGGLLLVAGLATRPVALLLFLEMLVAYALNHLPRPGFPVQNGGELALLYAAIFAFLAGNGAGAFSADAAMRRR